MANLAGASALEGYRSTRAHRRRVLLVQGLGLVVIALGGAVATALLVSGPARYFVAATSAVGFVLVVVVGPRPDPERWRRGAEGERATADILDRLPARRWTVMHDLRIPGSRANIDHLVIGRTGVWVVDTKTTRAVIRAGWRSVRFGERKLDARPCRWEASVVAERLGVAVRPIVAIHGEGMGRRGRAGSTRVVPVSRLARELGRGRRRLRRREINALAAQAASIFIEGAPVDGRSRS